MSCLRNWILCPLLIAVACCGSGEEPTDLAGRLRAAIRTADEGMELRREGREAAAIETLRRAYAETLSLLAEAPEDATDGPGRVDVLTQLALVAVELGPASPDLLGKAVRFAAAAIRASEGGYPPAWFQLGRAYSRAGAHELALTAIREGMSILPPAELEHHVQKLVAALHNRAFVILAGGRLGREGRAHALLREAWELNPDVAENQAVFRARAELQRSFEEEAGKAKEENDHLELARIHARYGLTEDAVRYLSLARNSLGLTLEVRWTEARYVLELSDDPERFRRARNLYEEMLGRGERLGPAGAGWARMTRAMGEPEKVLERFARNPEPISELREELIGAHLDRVRPGTADPLVEEEFAAARELLLGGLDPVVRANVLFRMGRLAGELERPEELRRTIREFQGRFPRDLRVVVLDAWLMELEDAPLGPEGGETDAR